MLDEKIIRKALQSVVHPKLRKSLIDIGMIRDIVLKDDTVSLTLALKSVRSPLQGKLIPQIEKVLGDIPEVSVVKVEVAAMRREEFERLFPRPHLKGVERVKHFLAVASGKGGVGKTSLAVNIALGLLQKGHLVGLLDADVYGPSIPLMLGLSDKMIKEGDMLIPAEKYGLRVASLGMTAQQSEAFIWRGPLVSKMIHRLLAQVRWGELDYLVIDLPPGTGDPSIAIAQALPHCSILMVTTPQEVALADVRRAVGLFNKTGQPIIGIVENMSGFFNKDSTELIEIFGHGGGERLSQETGIQLLGALPIDMGISQGGDKGIPLMVSSPHSSTGVIFQGIVDKISDIVKK